MSARDRARARALPIIALALIGWLAPAPTTRGAETVIVGDLTFVNKALVGVGRLPSDLRDKFGETFGSGSAIAVDPKSWVRTPAGYQLQSTVGGSFTAGNFNAALIGPFTAER